MERKLSKRALWLRPSPIQELSHLAQRCNAINLAEGFPDFPAPPIIKDAAIAAIKADFNQYRHVQAICDYLAYTLKLTQGLDVDPVKNIAICCGQSEAFAAAMLAVVDEGDEVLLLDPAYETYEACITIAGGTPVYVALNPPCWTLELEKLIAAFTPRTKAFVLNSPHNPTGKVFSKDELMVIADLCCRMDCIAITDEVYEHITFDSAEHISLASLPGMLERTIVTSSMSKTYGVTDSNSFSNCCNNQHLMAVILGVIKCFELKIDSTQSKWVPCCQKTHVPEFVKEKQGYANQRPGYILWFRIRAGWRSKP